MAAVDQRYPWADCGSAGHQPGIGYPQAANRSRGRTTAARMRGRGRASRGKPPAWQPHYIRIKVGGMLCRVEPKPGGGTHSVCRYVATTRRKRARTTELRMRGRGRAAKIGGGNPCRGGGTCGSDCCPPVFERSYYQPCPRYYGPYPRDVGLDCDKALYPWRYPMQFRETTA